MSDQNLRGRNLSNTNRRSARIARGLLPRSRATAAQHPARMADPRRTSSANRQYMFIEQDANRNTSSEAIRVHVMRESHRARRQLRGLMQTTESHGLMTILSSTPRRPGQQLLSRETSTSEEQSPARDIELTSAQRDPSTIDLADLKRMAEDRRNTVLTTTSAEIAAATPCVRILRSLPPNIVELCGDDAAALHALLALITAVQYAVGVLQAAEYESAALEILRSRLADPSNNDHVDETILTVLLLSRLERARLNEETAGFHEAALRRMIENRGGLSALADSSEALVTLLRSYGLGEGT